MTNHVCPNQLEGKTVSPSLKFNRKSSKRKPYCGWVRLKNFWRECSQEINYGLQVDKPKETDKKPFRIWGESVKFYVFCGSNIQINSRS